MADSSSRHFLDLPFGIRFSIYDYVSPDPEYPDQVDEIEGQQQLTTLTVSGHLVRVHYQPAKYYLHPLLTCRQMYCEAQKFAFQSACFTVNLVLPTDQGIKAAQSRTHYQLRHRVQYLGKEQKSWMKRLNLTVLALPAHPQQDKTLYLYADQKPNFLAFGFQNLQHITICMAWPLDFKTAIVDWWGKCIISCGEKLETLYVRHLDRTEYFTPWHKKYGLVARRDKVSPNLKLVFLADEKSTESIANATEVILEVEEWINMHKFPIKITKGDSILGITVVFVGKVGGPSLYAPRMESCRLEGCLCSIERKNQNGLTST